MPPSLKLISADDARRIVGETPPVGVELVPLRAAGGRVLAAPLVAPENLPGHRRSVMDGYAVRAADVQGASPAAPARLPIVGVVPMGAILDRAVGPGQAAGISTGGFLPAGADSVVMVEQTAEEPGPGGAQVLIRAAVAAGANVIQPGEDLQAGEAVLAVGRRLRPQDLAALATFGVAEVAVYRRPRIAVLSTGNELCEPTATPAPGQVRDVNQAVLGAQIESTGAQVTTGGIIRDDMPSLRAAVLGLLADHDGVMLSGGSSVGVKDVAAEALAALPAPGILFHGIDIRPGKPTLFARAGGKPVVGMPGFPTSSRVVFDAFMRPMLMRLGGEVNADPWPRRRRARLLRPYTSAAGREDYVRVRLVTRDGEDWAEPLAGGSAAIANVVRADGLVCVEAGCTALAQGQDVTIYLY